MNEEKNILEEREITEEDNINKYNVSDDYTPEFSEDDLIFTEEDTIPIDFYPYLPQKTLDDSLENRVYYLSAELHNKKCALAVFIINPDFSGAILSYIYVFSGYRKKGIGRALVKESVSRLSNIDCRDMMCFLYENDIDIVKDFLSKCGFSCKYDNALKLIADYEKIKLPSNDQYVTNERPGYLTDFERIDEKSKNVASLLEEAGIPFMCYEGIRGAGRFIVSPDNELLGVMLGNYNSRGDLSVLRYIDDKEGDNPQIFVILLYEILSDFIKKSTFNNEFSIICTSSMQRDMAEELIGVNNKTERTSVYWKAIPAN